MNNLLSKTTLVATRFCQACHRGATDCRGCIVPSLLLHRISGSNCVAKIAFRGIASKLRLKNDHSMASNSVEPFRMKKALVLTKFSRLEFEQRLHAECTESQLRTNVGISNAGHAFDSITDSDAVHRSTPHGPLILQLQRRGSDYANLKHHHETHTKSRDSVVTSLKAAGVETQVVNRFEYTTDKIDWADVIFTTGGDGTFLMAASKVTSRDKPVIGINTDPESSVGHLCLPPPYSVNFERAVEKLHTGQFQWMYRQRLRVTLEGENALEEPIELHDQQLHHYEHRYLDLEPRSPDEQRSGANVGPVGRRTLPVRALNEIFAGESLSSRVSYYEIAIDGQQSHKLKSSGLTVCTGTGSTSWTFNINKVTPQCVRSLCSIIQDETGTSLPVDSRLVQRITQRFNQVILLLQDMLVVDVGLIYSFLFNKSLIFSPADEKMAYTIRDPVIFGTNFNSNPRGFAKRVDVRSRMFDACLVIDGALSYKFNDGAKASFTIHDEDALKTVFIE